MKKLFALTLCTGLLAGAVALSAQPGFGHRGGPPGFGHREDFLARYLDLTDAQKAAVEKIHDQAEAKAKPLFEQHRAQMDEVRALLDGVNPDPTEIGRKVIASHATGEQLKALHEETQTKIAALLTAEQKAKFDKLKDFHRGPGGPGGPEGFGPPGPGF